MDHDTLHASLGQFVWLLHKPPALEPAPMSVSSGVTVCDDAWLVRRIMEGYRREHAIHKASSSFWDDAFAVLKRDIHNALVGDDLAAASNVLRNPAESTFFWGFDSISQAPPGWVEPHENVIRTLNPAYQDWKTLYAYWMFDSLEAVAESMATRRLPYPETSPAQIGMYEQKNSDVDSILDQIEEATGIAISFPNPFPGEIGLISRRGIVGFRAIQSLYQAWRIRQLARGNPGFSVLEIGAGLGRTAYYANLFGIKDYTIIDIPMTNAAQRYFIGRVMGEEPANQINIVSTSQVIDRSFDLVFNADSWTELSHEVAIEYWNLVKRVTRTVLSINHEHNVITVRSIYADDPQVTANRFPYWPRRGYVEELISW